MWSTFRNTRRFCETGWETIRNDEVRWDDVTHRVEETQQELGHDVMMLRKTFHDVFTPADPQTALHTWRTGNTAGSHTDPPTRDDFILQTCDVMTSFPSAGICDDSLSLWVFSSPCFVSGRRRASCTHWGCPAPGCTLWRWAEVQEVLWGTSSGSQRERGRQRTDRSPPASLDTFRRDKSLLTRRHQQKHSEQI